MTSIPETLKSNTNGDMVLSLNNARRRRFSGVKSSRAFTLIEVMVVLIVVGVLAGMIVPAVADRREKSKLRSASQQLWQAAQYTHQRAVLRGVDHRLVLLPFGEGLPGEGDSPGYRIEAVDEEGETGYTPITAGAYKPARFPQGVVLAAVEIAGEPESVGGERVIGFRATGQADAAAVVLMTTGREEAHSVLVSPNSGRAERVELWVDMLPNDREDLDG